MEIRNTRIYRCGRRKPLPCVVKYSACTSKPASGRPATELLSKAPTWLIMSHRKPSSDAGGGLLPQGAFGVGFANETAAYRVGLNFFSPSATAGREIPTHASPCSVR